MKEENILFYNNFFKKKNFLDYKKNNYEFLKEQGFNNSKIKNCKLILEIGAGKGRYTIPIIKKKIFPKLKQYHIVEPSNGCKLFAGEGNHCVPVLHVRLNSGRNDSSTK